MAKFNLKSIGNKVKAVFDDTAIGGVLARRKATEILRARQELMLIEFEEDEITQELEDGYYDPVNTANDSGTLNGEANLYAFIGFNEGYNPAEALRKILKRRDIIRLGRRKKKDKSLSTISFTYPILVPTNGDLENQFGSELSMPKEWHNGIWPIEVSKKISGFAYYISAAKSGKDAFSNPPSRSTGGLQTKNINGQKWKDGEFGGLVKVRNEEYQPRPYLTKIFAILKG